VCSSMKFSKLGSKGSKCKIRVVYERFLEVVLMSHLTSYCANPKVGYFHRIYGQLSAIRCMAYMRV
jgi:hypothetical protein